MNGNVSLVTAAGGNGTAIQTLEQPLDRSQYAQRGRVLGEEMERYGAEQAGFLIASTSRFEMAGGEFCGNASRAAAVLFSNIAHRSKVSFTVSGFEGVVSAVVQKHSDVLYDVRCEFPGMPTEVQHVVLANGQKADIVDLGGIVHVVIEGEFPEAPEAYEEAHRSITQQFNLGDREAVGVVWFQRDQNGVQIHPVVWVKAVDTFFYEESCGSGTIAVAKVTGESQITQPTGKGIRAEITEGLVVLASEMEVVR
jgi:diaminopimelate epimerase